MRVLIVKTSSLGDLIHTFPALSDARSELREIEFHWLVEEAFQEVPGWHPAVVGSLPIALRRWRKSWRRAWRSGELSSFRSRLEEGRWDLVIDAQGLLKSALPARLAGAPVAGYDRLSIREPLAARFYHRRLAVSRDLHAIERIRRLFSAALEYRMPEHEPDYGLDLPPRVAGKRLLFLHGTTWPSKHWPEAYWARLARLAEGAGYRVQWPWHGEEERRRAERLVRAGGGERLPEMTLTELRDCLRNAAGAVGVDTGLAHLAAAAETPAVTLYGPTRVGLTGALGRLQRNLSADYPCAPCLRKHCARPVAGEVLPPCFATLPPELVWRRLAERMESAA